MGLSRAAGASLAPRLFPRGTPQALALLKAAWPGVVGRELARRTQVVALEGHSLRIRVPDAGWRRVLHRMQGEILARLREVVGELAPRRLGFTEGPVVPSVEAKSPPVEAAPEPPPLPPSLAAEAQAIPDPEIRQRFTETAARYLARPQGVRHA